VESARLLAALLSAPSLSCVAFGVCVLLVVVVLRLLSSTAAVAAAAAAIR
jgi:hypothetical protein